MLVILTMYEKYEIENEEKLRNNKFLNDDDGDDKENKNSQNAQASFIIPLV